MLCSSSQVTDHNCHFCDDYFCICFTDVPALTETKAALMENNRSMKEANTESSHKCELQWLAALMENNRSMKEANTESSHKCELQWILVACPTYTCSQLLPHPQAATNHFHPPKTAFFLQNYHLFIKLGKLYSELHENNGKATQLPDVLHLPTEECQNWHWKVVDTESLKTDWLWSLFFKLSEFFRNQFSPL